MNVSVVIPVHNRCRYLRKSILSILNQPVRSEIVVVDDASDDGSAETISDLPVTVIGNKARLGIAASRNRGVSRCTGSLIGFLDSDDLLAHAGLNWRIEFLMQHPDESAVMGHIERIIGVSDEGVSDRLGIVTRSRLGVDFVTAMALRTLAVSPFSPLSTTLFRGDSLKRVGPFDETLDVCSDWEYLNRYLNFYRITYCDRPVVQYRVHGGNVCIDLSRSDVMPRRVKALTYLIDREFEIPRWSE